MRLKTSKTDKLDAQMIRMYGESEQPKLWNPPSKMIIEAAELHKLIELLVRQRVGSVKQEIIKYENCSSCVLLLPANITKPVVRSIRAYRKRQAQKAT